MIAEILRQDEIERRRELFRRIAIELLFDNNGLRNQNDLIFVANARAELIMECSEKFANNELRTDERWFKGRKPRRFTCLKCETHIPRFCKCEPEPE